MDGFSSIIARRRRSGVESVVDFLGQGPESNHSDATSQEFAVDAQIDVSLASHSRAAFSATTSVPAEYQLASWR